MKVARFGGLALGLLFLAACGSGQSVDAGGFTSAQRKAAQTALDLLQQTSIPRRVVAISFQAGEAPSMCSVLPATGRRGTFKLFVAWRPSTPEYRTLPQTVLQATIAETSAAHVRFSVASYGGSDGKPEPPSVKATLVRAAIAKPAEQCQVLESGHLQLVPAK